MRQVLSWGVFLAVVVGSWVVVGPTSLGGPASYVIVDGTSMEPTYRSGDLVIARTQEAYGVGDVITYDAPIGAKFPVIHRVTAATDEGYVTQGDNRDQADGWTVPPEAVHGASTVVLPQGGVPVGWLRQPAVLIALFAGWLTLELLTRRDRRQRAQHDQAIPADPAERRERRATAMLCGAGLLVGLGAGVGYAHASVLVVNAGTLQAFELPAVLDPPDPEPGVVEITLRYLKFNSGNGGYSANSPQSELSRTFSLTSGVQYALDWPGGAVVSCDVVDYEDAPAVDEVELTFPFVVDPDVSRYVFCYQTGGNGVPTLTPVATP